MPRCVALRGIPSDHFHRGGGGIVREEQGLIGPLPVFSLGRTPSSPACSARQPVRPIEQRDTHTRAPGPCHRAMPSPSKNEVTRTRRPNLVEPRLARPLPFLSPPTPICLPPPQQPRPPTRGHPFQRNGQQSAEPTCRALSPARDLPSGPVSSCLSNVI